MTGMEGAILQDMGKTQVVYMPDINAGHIVLGEAMGICDIFGNPSLHAQVERVKYTTNCGVAVDAWKLVGETAEVYVLPSKVKITGKSAPEMAKALNSFNSPQFRFDRHVFTGKFRGGEGKQTVEDKAGRRMTTFSGMMKDMPGIYNLMVNLGKDDGHLFDPVIARYISLLNMAKQRASNHKPVGFLDLKDYLCVLRDERRNMFSRVAGTAALLNIELGKNPYVVVKSVDPKTGQAMIEFEDVMVIDRAKDAQFRPIVLIANRPLELRQELQFRWTRITRNGKPLFLMPFMGSISTWKDAANVYDLLSAEIKPL